MKRNKSVIGYVLKALIPYTEANLKLSFSPNRFFNELEKITNANRNTLTSTLSRAKRDGLVSMRGDTPVLTNAGLMRLSSNVNAKRLKGEYLIVAFDIPEKLKTARDRFRYLLKDLEFEMVQRSLWISSIDYGRDLERAVRELDLAPFVKIYLAKPR